MSNKPNMKVMTNEAGSPSYDPDSQSRDKIGFYAEDFHDVAEMVAHPDTASWSGANMTRSSIFPESVIASNAIILGEEWNDCDGLVPLWDSNPSTDETLKWTLLNSSTLGISKTKQMEGNGCIQIENATAAPEASRVNSTRDLSGYVGFGLSVKSIQSGAKTVRIGTDTSNYVEYQLDVLSADAYYDFMLSVSGSIHGIQPASATGTIDWSDVTYFYIKGTSQDEILWVDLMTLHKESNFIRGNLSGAPTEEYALTLISSIRTSSTTSVWAHTGTSETDFARFYLPLSVFAPREVRMFVRGKVSTSDTANVRVYLDGSPLLTTSFTNLTSEGWHGDSGWTMVSPSTSVQEIQVVGWCDAATDVLELYDINLWFRR